MATEKHVMEDTAERNFSNVSDWLKVDMKFM